MWENLVHSYARILRISRITAKRRFASDGGGARAFGRGRSPSGVRTCLRSGRSLVLRAFRPFRLKELHAFARGEPCGGGHGEDAHGGLSERRLRAFGHGGEGSR